MSDKHYVGLDLVSFSDNGKYKPVSRVTLMIDEENSVTAGDDTGAELVATCYHATQAMADALLAKFKGYEYSAFEAGAANLDPAAELGDGITADGHYSVIARLSDDGNGYPSPSAPGKAELDDEYPSGGPMTQEFNRKIAQTNSRITKTAEEVLLEVTGLNDKYTSLSVTIDGVTVKDETGATRIKGSSIETDSLYVNAANITGTLTADQIRLSGSITWDDLSGGVQSTINGAYTSGLDEDDVTTLITSTLVSSPTIMGGAYYDNDGVGKLTLSYANQAWLTFETTGAGRELFSVTGTDYGDRVDVAFLIFAGKTVFQHYASTDEITLHNVNIVSPLTEALADDTVIATLKSVLGIS